VCSRVGEPVAVAETQTVTIQQPQQHQGVNESILDHTASRSRRLAQNAARRTEPLKPYEPSHAVEGWAVSLLRVFGRVGEASHPDDESEDPVALLDAHVPLQTMVRKHGFDITELINDPPGVTIADFFRNGYTIGEMCDAFSSRMNPTEGMRVLYFLGMTDEFISARPDQAQVHIMKSRMGFNTDSLLHDLDYRFVPGRWTLPQMLEVGLTMPVVMAKGMQTRDEWIQLQGTRANDADLIRFGVTPELEAQLARTHVPETAAIVASETAPTVVVTQPKTVSQPRVTTVADPTAILQATPAVMHGQTVLLPVQKSSAGATFIPTPLGTTTPKTVLLPAWTPQQPSSNKSTPPAPAPAPVAAPLVLPPPRVDTTPKLVDRSVLPILSQHQTTQQQRGKYALK